MLNQAAVEALCSATYLENFLECMDSLPEEMQRNITVLRELDSQCNDLLTEIEHLKANVEPNPDPATRKKTLQLIQRNLIKCQELGDEKIQIVSQVIELVECRSRQLHQDLENLDPIGDKEPLMAEMVSLPQKPAKQPVKQTIQAVTPPTQQYVQETHKQTHVVQSRQTHQAQHTPQPLHPTTVITAEPKSTGKRPRRQRQFENREEEKKEEVRDLKPKKKKKRKVKKDNCTVEVPIDPDEPTYCLCDQVSYGEMIGCDNEECKIEWFHFNCVNLSQKPKGKWYCPNCRGETSKVPRKDLK